MFLCFFCFVFFVFVPGAHITKKRYAMCKSGTYFHDLFTMTCNIITKLQYSIDCEMNGIKNLKAHAKATFYSLQRADRDLKTLNSFPAGFYFKLYFLILRPDERFS